MIPSPRAKFSAKPPSGYKHFHPVLEREQQRRVVGVQQRQWSARRLSSKRFGGISNSWNVSGDEAHRFAAARHWWFPARRPATARQTCRTGCCCAVLNFTRSCSGLSCRKFLANPRSICHCAGVTGRHELINRLDLLADLLPHFRQIRAPASPGLLSNAPATIAPSRRQFPRRQSGGLRRAARHEHLLAQNFPAPPPAIWWRAIAAGQKRTRRTIASNAAFSDTMPSHLPSQICQRAIGLVATTWIWHSSMSRASVPQASQSVESPSSAVMALKV